MSSSDSAPAETPGVDRTNQGWLVQGTPTEDELAAVVTVLSAAGTASAARPAPRRAGPSPWLGRDTAVRPLPRRGPQAWRHTFR